jgi:hypothetical protein
MVANNKTQAEEVAIAWCVDFYRLANGPTRKPENTPIRTDFFRNSEMKSSSRRTTGEDRSLLRVNEDRSQAFNNEIDYITTFRKKSNVK